MLQWHLGYLGVNSRVKQYTLMRPVQSLYEAGVHPEEAARSCDLLYLYNERVLGFRELENIQLVL